MALHKSICEILNVSMKGYKCVSDGEKSEESNSCDSVKDTAYDINSTDLKKICDLFEFCEPYEKGCKTKIIGAFIVLFLLLLFILFILFFLGSYL